ncbi:hypothetical protein [Pararhizobium haloflavum]|uniref:hypothetical protein n=1 Tax=Pararhizobium haloflavum TaxID=2037914 RepID=UPI0012FFF5B9|nr:hypothetical protein [Pararhizobium haloflavum]
MISGERVALQLPRGTMRFPTTLSYAPLHDHKRLPGRFHARLTGADGSDIG